MAQRSPLHLHLASLAMLGAIITLAYLVAKSTSRLGLSIHSVQAADLCPFRTPEEWQVFLERMSEDPKWVETCEDSSCDADFYSFVETNIQDTFNKCSSFFDQNPGIARCVNNMRRFTPSWLKQHDEISYGFAASNNAYLAAQESPDKPEGMMKVPDAIVAALPYRDKVEEAARKNGYPYLTHDSALKGIRTFVLVSDPKGRFDLWLLLNLPDKKVNKVQANTPLSVLAVQKADAQGHKFDQVQLHFRDYTIVKLASRYKLNLFKESNGKCYSCHANGVRQLIARRTPVLSAKAVRGEDGFTEDGSVSAGSDFAYERLQEFNRRLRSYGRPNWAGMIEPAAFGPPLGVAQGCLDCHNGQSRAVLTVATSPAQLQQKILRELGMPYDSDAPRLLERAQMKNPPLTPAEEIQFQQQIDIHKTLTQQFMDSRFPALKKWFLETPCRL